MTFALAHVVPPTAWGYAQYGWYGVLFRVERVVVPAALLLWAACLVSAVIFRRCKKHFSLASSAAGALLLILTLLETGLDLLRQPRLLSWTAFFAVLTIAPGLFIFIRALMRRPADRRLCPSCGYDLHANESQRCPECGSTTPHWMWPAYLNRIDEAAKSLEEERS